MQQKVAKLKSQFGKLVKQYRKVTDAELAATKHAMEGQPSFKKSGGAGGAPQTQSMAQKEGSIQFTVIEADVDLKLLQERKKDYEEIQRDARELQSLASDVDGLVSEQGIELELVEKNVVKAQGRVARGAEDLGEAREYQRRYRRKMMCLPCSICCPCFFD